MSGRISWRSSVLQALRRRAARSGDPIVTRQALIEHELACIMVETGCKGKTPEQTLSWILQKLRDEHFVEFIGSGQYRLVPSRHPVPDGKAVRSSRSKSRADRTGPRGAEGGPRGRGAGPRGAEGGAEGAEGAEGDGPRGAA
jgi:hypothetical protein